jgi:uncharacterized membrane protein
VTKDKLRVAARIVLSLVFVGVGVAHFAVPADFVAIMPPYLPYHLELVYLSGVFEVALGLAILVPSIRRYAGWGMVALLIAVFPANVQHALHPPPHMDVGMWGYVRLPFQIVFVVWTLWVTRDEPSADG